MTKLDVTHEDRLVGRAEADDGAARFAFCYADEWLERPEAFPISASLPLTEQLWAADRAHPFFANLLPEGVARESICARLGVSPDNDVALLRELGDDTAGALRFVAEGRQPDPPLRQRRPIRRDELEEWAAGAPAFPADSERPPRLSLAGAQHKASVVLTPSGYALPAWGEPSTHILKFDSPRFPHLTANEYLTTRFAAELGLEVVESRLDARTSPPMLVVERYDRELRQGAVRRLHQEDFCQILGVLPSHKYEADGGPSLAQVAAAIRSFSARPAADLLALVRWVIFGALAGNADGHAKNLAMLYGQRGRGLAPFYDLVCTRAFPRLARDLAFSVGGQRDPDRILREHWERLAVDIDVRPRLVFGQLDRLVDAADTALDRACQQLADQVGDTPALQHVPHTIRKRIRAVSSHL